MAPFGRDKSLTIGHLAERTGAPPATLRGGSRSTVSRGRSAWQEGTVGTPPMSSGTGFRPGRVRCSTGPGARPVRRLAEGYQAVALARAAGPITLARRARCG